MACPANTGEYGKYDPKWISYKMTQAHRDHMARRGLPLLRGLPMSAIQNPATSLLVADGQGHPDFLTWDEAVHGNGHITFRHQDRANALFADGHVATYTKQQMQENWDRFYTRAVE